MYQGRAKLWEFRVIRSIAISELVEDGGIDYLINKTRKCQIPRTGWMR